MKTKNKEIVSLCVIPKHVKATVWLFYLQAARNSIPAVESNNHHSRTSDISLISPNHFPMRRMQQITAQNAHEALKPHKSHES